MTLSEYDARIKPHLHAIEVGARWAARHAMQLPVKPDFRTLAQDELQAARQVLQNALACIIYAQNAYDSKPTED